LSDAASANPPASATIVSGTFKPMDYPPPDTPLRHTTDRQGEAGFSCAWGASSDVVNWTQVDVQDNATGSIVFSLHAMRDPFPSHFPVIHLPVNHLCDFYETTL